jgi:hypothetical protein
VGSRAEHEARAAEALAAAQALRTSHPAWALVPLFYSAMHLMHAKFDVDALPAGQRHPELHRTQRDATGAPVRWGTLDVVVQQYPASVSRAYRSLFQASTAVRYGKLTIQGGGSRLWADYEIIKDFV